MFTRIFLICGWILFLGWNHGSAANGYVAQDSSWTTGGSVGLDLAQLMLFNPRIGGGENRLAFGGLSTLFANYKEGKALWVNDGSLQLAVQRLGDSSNPFSKNLDLIRLNSKYGYQFSPKWYVGALFGFESLLFNTYSDLKLSSDGNNYLQARFLSPATMLFAPGIDYVKDGHLSLFLSPFAYKATLVMDDAIAALGVHGNPWTSSTDFKNIKHELGGNIKMSYKQLFLTRLSVGSELNLFYDYLAAEHGVEFLDVAWINELGLEIAKGLSLAVLLDARWDRDLASVLPEGKTPDGIEEFRKWMITESVVLKYNYTFK